VTAGAASERLDSSSKKMYGSSQLKRDDLKEKIARRSYEIDPRQVAAAIIVKLALGEEGSLPVAPRGGPSRRAGGPHPDRQAA
jgi:hypothetical protein